MPQQLNLQDLRFVPRPLPCSARQVALGAALFLLTLGVSGQLLRLGASRDEAQARDIATKLEPMRQQIAALGRAVAPPPAASATAAAAPSPALNSLQTREQAQQRVLQLLRSGIAGQGDGHAETLAALARQANAHVWITGLHVGEDGGEVELRGNMTETARFADYLKRLNAEPRFRGRPFSQLRMSAQAGDATAAESQARSAPETAPGLTVFTLTSTQRARITPPAAELPVHKATAPATQAASAAARAGGIAAAAAAPDTTPTPNTTTAEPVKVALRPAGRPAGTPVADRADAARRPGQRRHELQETVPPHELQRLQQQALLARVTQTQTPGQTPVQTPGQAPAAAAAPAPEIRRLAQAGPADARRGDQP
ncbi:MAG: hypothetical protein RL223_712 [Pseudomonadota bacterium]|jgi:hypothetical protein